MISTIFGILGSALSIWESKEKTKYMDKYIKLKKEWYEEYHKEPRDDASLDNLEFELKLLVDAVSAEIERSNASNS